MEYIDFKPHSQAHKRNFEKAWHSVLKFVPEIIQKMNDPEEKEKIPYGDKFVEEVVRYRNSWNRLLIGYRFPQVTTDLCTVKVNEEKVNEEEGKKITQDHVFGTTSTGYYHKKMIIDKEMDDKKYYDWLKKNNNYILFGLTVIVTPHQNKELSKKLKKMWSDNNMKFDEKIKYIINLRHYQDLAKNDPGFKLEQIRYLKNPSSLSRRYNGYGKFFDKVMANRVP